MKRKNDKRLYFTSSLTTERRKTIQSNQIVDKTGIYFQRMTNESERYEEITMKFSMKNNVMVNVNRVFLPCIKYTL